MCVCAHRYIPVKMGCCLMVCVGLRDLLLVSVRLAVFRVILTNETETARCQTFVSRMVERVTIQNRWTKMFDLNVKLRTHAPFQTCSQRLGLDDVTGSRRPVSTPLVDSTVTELKLQFALNGHSTFKKVREVRLVVCFYQDRSLIVRWVWHLSNSNMYMKRRLEDQVE